MGQETRVDDQTRYKQNPMLAHLTDFGGSKMITQSVHCKHPFNCDLYLM